MKQAPSLQVTALAGLPLFYAGMDVAAEICAAAELRDGDVVVVAQKIVSKAEGRLVRLGDVAVGAAARELADTTGRNPALCQLILDESSVIMRANAHAIITRHRSGHVLANAGIDASNVQAADIAEESDEAVLLWPLDADASARKIRANIAAISGVNVGVIIADSMGRAWRIGTLGTAIGAAGVQILDDQRGKKDMFGRVLQATVIGAVDSLAAMAVLAMGEGAQATPVAVIRGASDWIISEDGDGAVAGLRAQHEDMFR
ncbi:MAG: hypothetical protein RLY97_1064 [Pseudomonadota bacterium]|jgi:coenzyme F420-0:L-glutamate ligase/coenzyme F420-1:gamma-L-glutamate ligase